MGIDAREGLVVPRHERKGVRVPAAVSVPRLYREVRCAAMIDRTPTYATGVQFLDPDEPTLATIDLLATREGTR